jgi:hypothetical protein
MHLDNDLHTAPNGLSNAAAPTSNVTKRNADWSMNVQRFRAFNYAPIDGVAFLTDADNIPKYA